MGKAVKIILIFIVFIYAGTKIFAEYRRNRINLQEEVTIDLKIRGNYKKTQYIIRFSTEDNKENFKIISRKKDIEI